jgi:hypothetical protein
LTRVSINLHKSLSKKMDGRVKPGHDAMRGSLELVWRRRRLPQTLPAQAILAADRHRQARGFGIAPAFSRQAAGEFHAATGTGEAARGGHRASRRIAIFQPIGHEPGCIVTGF